MIQATSSINCSPIKPSKHNFGQREDKKIDYPIDYQAATELLDQIDLKHYDENTAEAIGKFAETIKDKKKVDKDGKEVEYVPPFKLLLTTLSLAGLAGVVTKGFYNKLLVFIEKNTGVVDWASKEGSKAFSRIAEKVKPTEAKTFKGFVSRTASNTINWCKDYAQKGVDKIDIEKAVEAAKNQAKGKPIDLKAIEMQTFAKNGIKKATGTIAGFVSAGTVIGEKTKKEDDNHNGIPDSYEKKNQIHENIKKTELLEAVLDAAT